MNVSEPLAELLGVLVAGVLSLSLSAVGLVAERAALQNVLTDHLIVGVWEAWIGALALFAGVYLLGYQRVWVTLRERRAVD